MPPTRTQMTDWMDFALSSRAHQNAEQRHSLGHPLSMTHPPNTSNFVRRPAFATAPASHPCAYTLRRRLAPVSRAAGRRRLRAIAQMRKGQRPLAMLSIFRARSMIQTPRGSQSRPARANPSPVAVLRAASRAEQSSWVSRSGLSVSPRAAIPIQLIKHWSLVHFPISLNRWGFPNLRVSDSNCVLAEEAGMHGQSSFL